MKDLINQMPKMIGEARKEMKTAKKDIRKYTDY